MVYRSPIHEIGRLYSYEIIVNGGFKKYVITNGPYCLKTGEVGFLSDFIDIRDERRLKLGRIIGDVEKLKIINELRRLGR
jgi:hypothetical protein